MTVIFNPPQRPKRKRKKARTGHAVARMLRAAKKRKAKRKAKARRSAPMAKRRRRSSKRKAAARKAAATRSRKRAKRSRAAKKAARTRRRRRGSRRTSRRRSRPFSRRRRSSGRRRRSRGRRRSTAKRGKHRPTVYYKKGRGFYQKRRGRLGLKGHRVNPPLVPTFGSVLGILKDGTAVVGGYAGVNAVMFGAEMLGASKLYGSQSPMVQALIKTGLRVLSVGIAMKVAGMVVSKPETRRLMFAGAVGNVMLHGIRDLASGMLPPAANNLLLGDGLGDYMTLPGPTTMRGMGDWLPPFAGSQPGSSFLPAPVASDVFV